MSDARLAAAAMCRFAAVFCGIGAVAVATAPSGRAAPSVVGQAPTPTPTPTPCPPDAFSAAGKPDLGVSLLGAGEGATTCGTTGSNLTLDEHAKPVSIKVDDKGLVVTYEFTSATPFVTYRKLNGVPMVEKSTKDAGEDRLEVTVGDPQRPRHFVTVAVNANAVCVLNGFNVNDPDQHRACTASSPSPSPTPKPSTAPGPACPPRCVLAGTVTVPLSFLGPALNTKPGRPDPSGGDGLQHFYFCYALRTTAQPTFRDTAAYVTAMTAPDPKTGANDGKCQVYGVRIIDGSRNVVRVAGQASDGNQKAASGSSGGDTSASSGRQALLRGLAAQSSAPSSTHASGSGGKIGALATFVHPLSFSMRASAHVANNGLFGSIDKQTQRYLADFSAEQAQVGPSGVSFAGTPNTSDTSRSSTSTFCSA